MSSRISSWNHRWLTLAGKILLIKSMLNVIPIYLMLVVKTPLKVVNELNSSLISFLWNDNIVGKEKIPLLAWDKVCLPKDLGGSGIRDLVN